MESETYKVVDAVILTQSLDDTIPLNTLITELGKARATAVAAGGIDPVVKMQSLIGGGVSIKLLYKLLKTPSEVVTDVLSRATAVETRRATYDALKLEFDPVRPR